MAKSENAIDDKVSASMKELQTFEKFSLLGGPLHRLGLRLGLVRNKGTNSVPLGLALGVFLWSILLVLASIGGVSDRLFSLSAIAGDIRLLVVIPLFFLCETSLDPRLSDFVSTIVRSGVVPGNALPALEAEIARTVRWKDAWIPEALCLVVIAFCGAVALVGKDSGVRPDHPSYKQYALGRSVGLDRLLAALSLSDVSLDLANCPLVPLPLALGETRPASRADPSRWGRGARVS